MSLYAQQADMISRYGTGNIQNWSDLDGAGAINTGRLQESLEHADAEINQALRGGGYAIPLVFQDTYAAEYVKHIATTIAGYWLYTSRGLLDTDPQGNKLKGDEQQARGTLAGLRAGWPRLACQRRWAPNPTAPGCF